jgi:plastocyanin
MRRFKTSIVREVVPSLALVFCCLGLSVPAGAENFTVQAVNLTFQPANLTISPGDTVTWTNVSGQHNVRATSGASFRCANGCDGQGGNGNPASNAWSFTRTFNAEGTIDYDCELHAGFGMTGRIVVAGNDVPGTLQFTSSGATVNESVGTTQVSVARVGGDDGAVSVSYTTSDGSATAGNDYLATSGTLSWADNDDTPKNFSVSIIDDDEDEANETINLMLSNPTGGAGLGASSATLTIRDNDDTQQNPGSIQWTNTMVDVAEGATIQISATRTGGSDGAVSVSYASSDGSAVAGADYLEAMGTLSWGGGESSPRSFQLSTLQDTEEEAPETINISLSNPTGGAVIGSPAGLTVQIADDDAPIEPCVADDVTLCLNGEGRYRVGVAWDTGTSSGAGRTFDIAQPDSGLFYFFQESNIELLVKVLDGCGINDRYWVFFAATTDVEFVLTVTDTETGASKVYTNPLGQAANAVTDTQAFATCP